MKEFIQNHWFEILMVIIFVYGGLAIIGIILKVIKQHSKTDYEKIIKETFKVKPKKNQNNYKEKNLKKGNKYA